MASRGINKVIIVGNVGQDPEVKFTPAGSAVANASIATSETWKDKQTGQAQERTEWHRVVFFNRLAEIVGEYIRKGSKLYIEGSLRTRKWQDQSGQERYATEIVASEMQMLDSRNDQGGSYAPQQPAPAPQQYAAPQGGQAAAAPRQQYAPPVNQQRTPGQQARQAQNAQQRQVAPPPPPPATDAFDDDIPF